jgi:hypothetical protein
MTPLDIAAGVIIGGVPLMMMVFGIILFVSGLAETNRETGPGVVLFWIGAILAAIVAIGGLVT